MTSQTLVRKYQEGQLTPAGLILQLLHERRQQTVAETLEILPARILAQLKQFVQNYRSDTKIFRGPEPEPKTVRFVTDWFEKATTRVRHSV